MSLFKRIWLAVMGLTLAAFLGSLLVNTYGARSYLEKQLYLKNLDNATALALSMSQIRDKDPVTIELLLAAQFDTGHYQEISLADPLGRMVVQRKQDPAENLEVPHWFVQLFPIKAAPGIAYVQDGWRQYGTITLRSQSKFAYLDLWRGMTQLLVWFLLGGVVAGLLGTLMLRLITRPLDRVVEQAHAISRRQFTTVSLPKAPELRTVVQAMNEMVTRVKQMFADEAARLEQLKLQVNHDSVTGLPNREFFIGRLREALGGEEAAPGGLLVLLRLADLDSLNARLGHGGTDAILQAVAALLNRECALQNHWLAARLRGSDFALLAPFVEEPEALADTLTLALRQEVAGMCPEPGDCFHLAVVGYRHGDAMDTLLARADNALAVAGGKGPNEFHVSADGGLAQLAPSAEAWRSLLAEAVAGRRFKLEYFPVLGTDGRLIHQEAVIRLQVHPEGAWLRAGDFMPVAERLKLTSALDLEVVRAAIGWLREGEGRVAVNLSAGSIADWGFHNRLVEMLEQHAALCPRLWIEVSEWAVFREPEAFHDLCHTLQKLGCHAGVEHFGHRLDELARLSELGLDYLKVDGSFVRDVQHNPGNQEFLRGLCRIAHNIGMVVIAEGVASTEEQAILPRLGFDGVTGPGVVLAG